jgi:hypothetical protein
VRWEFGGGGIKIEKVLGRLFVKNTNRINPWE